MYISYVNKFKPHLLPDGPVPYGLIALQSKSREPRHDLLVVSEQRQACERAVIAPTINRVHRLIPAPYNVTTKLSGGTQTRMAFVEATLCSCIVLHKERTR